MIIGKEGKDIKAVSIRNFFLVLYFMVIGVIVKFMGTNFTRQVSIIKFFIGYIIAKGNFDSIISLIISIKAR